MKAGKTGQFFFQMISITHFRNKAINREGEYFHLVKFRSKFKQHV